MKNAPRSEPVCWTNPVDNKQDSHNIKISRTQKTGLDRVINFKWQKNAGNCEDSVALKRDFSALNEKLSLSGKQVPKLRGHLNKALTISVNRYIYASSVPTKH